jgi:hypothetical protein
MRTSNCVVRRWLIGLVVLALMAGGTVAAYVWYRHENGVERTVHARLKTLGLRADWVSCSKDHTIRVGSATINYYRCELHGGEDTEPGGLRPQSSEVCVPFVGGRVATEIEARLIRLEDSFCENFS